MFDFSVWLSGSAFLTALIFLLGKSRRSKWVLVGSFVFLAASYSSELWANSYFFEVGCKGNALKGLYCPEWTIMTRIAVVHQMSLLFASLYMRFIFPLILVSILFLEWRAWIDTRKK